MELKAGYVAIFGSREEVWPKLQLCRPGQHYMPPNQGVQFVKSSQNWEPKTGSFYIGWKLPKDALIGFKGPQSESTTTSFT